MSIVPISWENINVEYRCPTSNLSYIVPLKSDMLSCDQQDATIKSEVDWDDDFGPTATSALLIPLCACGNAHETKLT